MMRCVLCGEDLDKYPSNKEHYVPQVIIREFDALAIPPAYDWATRQLEYTFRDDEYVSVPLSHHKKWAVVQVHEKCNVDASPMCRDLRFIIDNIDSDIDVEYMRRPLEYYAHLWKCPAADLSFIINGYNETVTRLQKLSSLCLYRPGRLDCGRIIIENTNKTTLFNDYEWHTIRIGARSALDEI